MRTFRDVLTEWKADRSLAVCAPLLGVSSRTLEYWLSGTHLPPRTRVPFLATALDMQPWRLRKLIDQAEQERDHAADGESATGDATATIPTGVRS